MANLIVEKGAVPKVTAKKITTYEYNEIYDIRETDYVYNDSTETDFGLPRLRPPHWNSGHPKGILEDRRAQGTYYNLNNESEDIYSWILIRDTYTDPLGKVYDIVTGIKLAQNSSDAGIVSNTPSSAGAEPPEESEGHVMIGTIYLYEDHKFMPRTPEIHTLFYDDRFSESVHDPTIGSNFCVVGDAIRGIEYEWIPSGVMEDFHYDEQGTKIIDSISIEQYSGTGKNTTLAPSLNPTISNEEYQPEIQSHTITVSEVVT